MIWDRFWTLAERYVDACERLADASAESAQVGRVHADNAKRIAAAQESSVRVDMNALIEETIRNLAERGIVPQRTGDTSSKEREK